MRQRLPIAFAQVKVGHTSENLLHKICNIIYLSDKINLKSGDMSLYQILACTIHGKT